MTLTPRWGHPDPTQPAVFKHFHLFLHIWDQYSWTKTKNFSTPIKAFSSETSVETVAAFAVLGFQLGAPPIILHPRPPTETSQKLDFFKNKTVFLPPLSPIFPNILSSCKWAVHRGRVIGNIPLDIWRYLW